jgi:hypothetical protein
LKISFINKTERDAFYQLLEFAAEGGEHPDTPTQALKDAPDVDREEWVGAQLKIEREHIQRMQTFLRSLASVMRFTVNEPDNPGRPEREVIHSNADFNDHSLIWHGHLTIGMICEENAERPWAAKWTNNS